MGKNGQKWAKAQAVDQGILKELLVLHCWPCFAHKASKKP